MLRAEAAHIDHNMPGIFSFAVLKPRITPLAPGSVCRGVGVKSAKELSIAMPTGVLVQFTDEEPKSQTPTTLHPRRHLRQPTWTLNCLKPTLNAAPKRPMRPTSRESRCAAARRLQMWSTMTLPPPSNSPSQSLRTGSRRSVNDMGFRSTRGILIWASTNAVVVLSQGPTRSPNRR